MTFFARLVRLPNDTAEGIPAERRLCDRSIPIPTVRLERYYYNLQKTQASRSPSCLSFAYQRPEQTHNNNIQQRREETREMSVFHIG